MTDPATKTDAMAALEDFGASFLSRYHRLNLDEIQTSQWQPGQSANVSKEDFSIRAKYSISDPVWMTVADDRRWALREAVQAGERALREGHRTMRILVEKLEALQAQSVTSGQSGKHMHSGSAKASQILF